MDIKEVQELKKRLTSDYEADKAAIDRVLTLLSSKNGGANGSALVSRPDSGITIEKKVADAIAVCSANFTLSDVMGKISELYPGDINRATVSSVIYRLKEANKITLIKAGRGRRAAIYGKI